MPKRVVTGIVTSDKMSKTRRVEIARRVKHPKYGKYVKRRTICYAHDEENTSGAGDLVELIESRPMSKLKRWELTRVIEKSTAVDLAALRAARKHAAETEAIEAAHIGDEDEAQPAADSDTTDNNTENAQ
ncbi:30S ribosomal protein S17 [Roseimaritima sediminicola]